MKRTFRDSSSKANMRAAETKDTLVNAEIANNCDGGDQLVALRHNRTSCLGGVSMRNTLCDDHLKPRNGKKDNFSKVGENLALIEGSNGDSDEEDQLATLRANRNACLGGDSVRHAMCDDHLKPRNGKKDNFSKVGENLALIEGSNGDADEEDQLATLRANRNACLGGDSMRHAMCDDHLKPRKGKKDNFTKVGENIALMREYNDDSDEEDQLAALRSNRNACLRSESMRNVMCDDHLKPRKGRKDNFSKVGENIVSMKDINNSTDDAEEVMKSHQAASICSQKISLPSCRSRNQVPLKKSIRSCSVSGPVNVNTTKAMKKNRATNMGGSNMRNILYGQNPTLPSLRSRNAAQQKKSFRSSSVSGSLDMKTENDMKSNRSFSMRSSDMTNAIYGRNSSPSRTGHSTVAADKAFRANRFAIMGGSAMKNLLYGNASSRTSYRTPLKTSIRSSSRSMNGREKEMTTNRSADTNRAGITLPPITSRSCAKTCVKSSARFTSGSYIDADKAMRTNRSRSMEDKSTNTVTGNAKPRRSSSTEGSAMKNLIYSRPPSPPASIATRKAPLKKSLRGTANHPMVNGGPMRAVHSITTDDSNSNNCIHDDSQFSLEESQYQEASADSVLHSNRRRPSSSRRSQSVGSYESKSETPRHETKPVIRHSAFEGDTMKNLLYGDYAPVTSTEPVYQYDDTQHKISDGEDTIEIQVQDEYPSSISLHHDAPDEENVTLQFFSVESPDEPVGVLIPYDVINQFSPECGDNIEHTAVSLKHGHLVDCTCRMRMRNQKGKHPCVRHIVPKDLQFYNEASVVLDIISSPFSKENDKENSAIEDNIARKYPNYYNNFVQKFNRQLSEKYRNKEQQSKMAVVTSYKKLLAEENLFSKRAKCPINKRENISGRMKDLEKDFRIACKNLKKDYPLLFVQLIQKNDFPSLALEKKVVEENRICLLELSQLGTEKLQEFEEMFTNQQFH
ncbi:hypothetical protein WA026_010512 [Henosepilachna vigintioctopunctata]|uniref:Uncharacterized protein n=1 Tax=Henosepilachna vigintioctopunctata TaxID=420089 RepID=A0AAW1V5U5_9CUCU